MYAPNLHRIVQWLPLENLTITDHYDERSWHNDQCGYHAFIGTRTDIPLNEFKRVVGGNAHYNQVQLRTAALHFDQNTMIAY